MSVVPILVRRVLFGALRNTYHNELSPEARLGVPRVYFEGHSGDNDALQELLDLLQITCVDPEQRADAGRSCRSANRERPWSPPSPCVRSVAKRPNSMDCAHRY